MSTSKFRDSNRLSSNDFKNIEEELKLLKPSPELFNYYLSRMNALIKNYDLMLDQINGFKKSSEAGLTYKQEYLTRNEEVSSLRSVLSDMQIYLHKEREEVLNLSMENDLLRIHLLKYHKKVERLSKILKLHGDTTLHQLLYIDEDRIKSLQVDTKQISDYFKNKSKRSCSMSSEKGLKTMNPEDHEAEVLRMAAVIEHRNAQISLLNDEILILNEDRELKQKEWEVEIKTLQNQVSILTKRLHERETELIAATHQAAKVGKELISKEVLFMKERNKVSGCLERFYELLQNVPLDYLSSGSSKSVSRQSNINAVMKQLAQRDNLLNWYHTQSKNLENQLKQHSKQAHEMELSYKKKIENVMHHTSYLRGKLEEENQRRVYDTEGLLKSIQILRDRIKCLEKKINKTISVGCTKVKQ